MNQSESRAKRLLREMGDDPSLLLTRRAYRRSTFLRLYLEHVDGLLFDDPWHGLPWAQVAPKLAALVAPKQPDTLALAHAVLAGALRSTGQYRAAEKEYELAYEKNGSPLARAEIDSRHAMLRACQRQMDEAYSLCLSAVGVFRKESHGNLGEALARLGYVLNESRRFAEAIPCHGEALSLSEPRLSARHARVHHVAVHNLAYAALNAARPAALRGGLAQVRMARGLLRSRVDNVPRHKLGWVEGLLWWSLHCHPRAARALEIARRGFERLALPYEIVLVSIDLACAHLFLRDFHKAAGIAEEALNHVQVLESDDEAIAVLKIWVEAVKAREVPEKISMATRQMVESRIGPGGCCRSKRR